VITGCPPNEPWRTAGRSLPMLDAAVNTHILRCCKVYELYLSGSLSDIRRSSVVGWEFKVGQG